MILTNDPINNLRRITLMFNAPFGGAITQITFYVTPLSNAPKNFHVSFAWRNALRLNKNYYTRRVRRKINIY